MVRLPHLGVVERRNLELTFITMRVTGRMVRRWTIARWMLSGALASAACAPSLNLSVDAGYDAPVDAGVDAPIVTDTPVTLDVQSPADVSVAVDMQSPADMPVAMDAPPPPVDVPPPPVDVPPPPVDVPPPPVDVVTCAGGATLCGAVCASTMTDLAHCGGCGRACAPANATAMCTGGACRVARCNTGFVDCDGEAANGCESAPMTDARNCGGCGIVCGGAATCVAGTCVCGGEQCGGRCVDTATDAAHCGVCGFACPSGVTCASSRCGTMACAPGLTECGGRCLDATSDNANCGACGRVCGTGTSCVRGACATTPWFRQYGASGEDHTYALARDAAGNVYAGGSFSGNITLGSTTYTSTTRGWIARFSPTGALQWSAAAGMAVRGLALDASNNLYAVGSFTGTTTVGTRMLGSAGSTDWFAASYAPDGAVRWAVRQGGTTDEAAWHVGVDNAGRVWVAGYFSGGTSFDGRTVAAMGNLDVFVAQLNAADGTPRGFLPFGSAAYDLVRGLAVDPTDGAAVAITFGTLLTVGTATAAGSAVCGAVVRLGPDLSSRWNTVIQGGSNLNPSDLARDAAGNFYVSGEVSTSPVRVGSSSFPTGSTSGNGFVASLDASGAYRWGVAVSGSANGSSDDAVDAVSVAPDGTVLALGTATSPMVTVGGASVPRGAGGRAHWLAAISPSGAVSSVRAVYNGLTVYDPCLLAGNDDVLIGGRMFGMGTFEGTDVARAASYEAVISRSPG